MKVFREYEQELAVIESYLKGQANPQRALQILEAGCGREWYFNMAGVNYDMTGMDMDEAALASRQANKGDLKHSIVGDLRTATLPAEQYDVIYNAFVLEHVPGALSVLENFVIWLKPGGILVVRVPDRDSAQGFFARMTPHWVHILYYRWVWKLKDAGKPGFAPYKTIYDPVVSRAGLRQFCESHHLSVLEEIGVGTFERGHGILRKVQPVVARLISLLSLGRVHADFVDFTIVARKAALETKETLF